MADLMDKILELVLQRVEGVPDPVVYDDFTDDADRELMIRHDPAPATTKRYLSGGRWCGFNFSFYSKHTEGEPARALLADIEAALLIDNFLGPLGLSRGKLTTKTNPHFIGKTDRGARIYTSSYELVFFKEGS